MGVDNPYKDMDIEKMFKGAAKLFAFLCGVIVLLILALIWAILV